MSNKAGSATYMSISGSIERRIRSGELTASQRLPSVSEIAKQYEATDVAVLRAIELLRRRGLVHSTAQPGVFVARRLECIRVSPERQLETAEAALEREVGSAVHVERVEERVTMEADSAYLFGFETGGSFIRTTTKTSEAGHPVSISDTYQHEDTVDISKAAYVDETMRDQVPILAHVEWLGLSGGETVKTVHQRFLTPDEKAIMVSDVSYQRNRYDAFGFRMALNQN